MTIHTFPTDIHTELVIEVDPPPIRIAEGGVARIGDSRVSLDLVVEQYENGMSAEDLVRAYDTLKLADVYAAIAFYLRHRDAVGDYMKRRADEAAKLRSEIEAKQPAITRDILLARRAAIEANNAAIGD